MKDTINNQSIYIKDSDGNKLENYQVNLENDLKTVKVALTEGTYEPGKTYYLYITKDVKNASGESLKKPVKMKFEIVAKEESESDIEKTLIDNQDIKNYLLNSTWSAGQYNGGNPIYYHRGGTVITEVSKTLFSNDYQIKGEYTLNNYSFPLEGEVKVSAESIIVSYKIYYTNINYYTDGAFNFKYSQEFAEKVIKQKPYEFTSFDLKQPIGLNEYKVIRATTHGIYTSTGLVKNDIEIPYTTVVKKEN